MTSQLVLIFISPCSFLLFVISLCLDLLAASKKWSSAAAGRRRVYFICGRRAREERREKREEEAAIDLINVGTPSGRSGLFPFSPILLLVIDFFTF